MELKWSKNKAGKSGTVPVGTLYKNVHGDLMPLLDLFETDKEYYTRLYPGFFFLKSVHIPVSMANKHVGEKYENAGNTLSWGDYGYLCREFAYSKVEENLNNQIEEIKAFIE